MAPHRSNVKTALIDSTFTGPSPYPNRQEQLNPAKKHQTLLVNPILSYLIGRLLSYIIHHEGRHPPPGLWSLTEPQKISPRTTIGRPPQLDASGCVNPHILRMRPASSRLESAVWAKACFPVVVVPFAKRKTIENEEEKRSL